MDKHILPKSSFLYKNSPKTIVRSSSTGNMNNIQTYSKFHTSFPKIYSHNKNVYLDSTVYFDSKIFKAKNLEKIEKNIRKIGHDIKNRRNVEINSIYKAKMKHDFIKNFSSLYLTGHDSCGTNDGSNSNIYNFNNQNNQDSLNLNVTNENGQKKELQNNNNTNNINNINNSSMEYNLNALNENSSNFQFDNTSLSGDINNSNNITDNRNKTSCFPTIIPINHKEVEPFFTSVDGPSCLKMSLAIGDLYGEKINSKDLRDCVVKMSLLKIFSRTQNQRIYRINNERVNEFESCENNLASLKKAKELLISGYDIAITDYLKFLSDRIDKEKLILNKILDKKALVQRDILKIIKNIMTSQTEKEESISCMNFLKCVKMRQLTLRKEDIENESFFFELRMKNYLLRQMNEVAMIIQSSDLNRFINKLDEDIKNYKTNIEDDNNILLGSNNLDDIIQNTNQSNLKESKRKLDRKQSVLKSYTRQKTDLSHSMHKAMKFTKKQNELKMIKLEPVFNSPEEFIDIFYDLKKQGLQMLEENNLIRRNIQELLKEKEEVNQEGKRLEYIENILKGDKQKKLNEAKEKNILYRKQLEEIRQGFLAQTNDDVKSKNYKKKVSERKNKGKEPKFAYEEIKNKLNEMLKSFISQKYPGLNQQTMFKYIKPKEYYEIDTLEIDKTNKELICPACLKLLKLLELLLMPLFDRDDMYNNDPKIKLKKDKITKAKKNEAKVTKARIIRVEMELQHQEKLEEINNRSKKSYFLSNRRSVPIENTDFLKKRALKISNNQQKKEKGVFDELYEYIGESDDNE